jgi:signal transduction histidine kinase
MDPTSSLASPSTQAMTSSETPNETIRALWVVAAAAVLIPVLLFGGAALEDRSAVLHRAEHDGRKTLALLHEQAANLLSGHEIILDTIVERVRGHDWEAIEASPDLLNDLENMDNRLDDASAILLVDQAGNVRATTLAAKGRAAPDHDCFLALSAGKSTTCVTQPYIDAASGSNLFSLCRRLEADGQFKGVAQVAISVDYFLDLWEATAPDAAATVILLRSDGVVLAQYPHHQNQPLWLSPNAPLMMGLKQGGEGIVRVQELAEYADQITLYKRVASYPVYISIGLDRNAILAEWFHNLLIYGAVALAATLALVVAAGVALRRAQRERRAVALWQAEVKERETTQHKLFESQVLERLGQKQIEIQRDFIADAAHELRTPLSVLRVRVDTMKDQEIAHALRSDIGAMSRTVNQLLDIAQSETLVVGPDEHADLQSLCSETVAHLAPLALAQQKDVALTGTEQPVWVRGNAESLLHALRNLLENALAHTAVGTSAEIDLDPAGVIRVSDCGPGVAAHERELVFRRFWRRDRRRTGSAGLGLSIVSRIVEAHGGTITVGDRAGGGAVFTLSLATALIPTPDSTIIDLAPRRQEEFATTAALSGSGI